MNLKIGGSNVGKIMYGGQEFGGATKLEPGTVLYLSNKVEHDAKNVHLLSTTKNWSNVNGINVIMSSSNLKQLSNLNITGYDFKNLDEEKTNGTITASRSIVDGEYRLNFSGTYDYIFVIKAL